MLLIRLNLLSGNLERFEGRKAREGSKKGQAMNLPLLVLYTQ